MARFSAGVLTGAGTSVRPMISLYNPAASVGILREVGAFNTTSTAVAIRLVRLTTTGTQGAGLTEARYNPKGPAALCTAFTTHTADATVGDDLGYRAVLGAAVGSAVIWTFGDHGIQIGLPRDNGTGQACQAYFVWDE